VIDPARLVRPPALATGDTVAAVTMSWGGPAAFPDRYEVGVRQLEDALGVRVVEMPHTRADPAWLAANPRARADDLLAAFADPSIRGIVATIGGDDSIRCLPFLDLPMIRANPKVVLGFSDTTVTHLACLRAGLVTFYGPAIMAGFAENGGPHTYTLQGVRAATFEPSPDRVWAPNEDGWTVEHLDWGNPANQERIRSLRPTTGWRWLGGDPSAGPLVGGCLEPLDWVRGTEWWPDLDGAVLALETSEEAPPPASVARFLRSLAASGDLARLAGLLFARPGGPDLPVADHPAYDEAILGVIRDEARLEHLPVVTGMDFGHTDPMWTLALGTSVEIDPSTATVRFPEPGVAERVG
jgi:muramoyltetrapeptide carboxypeptidase LdcA involved in peptidoglycan recycling